jgi:UDP-2,4-diacetamido-2,4,6-trideoxy-beta-L-altropyranose hydrolase
MERSQGKHLIVRVDASTEIGTGHLMRCLALAQAWKDAGGEITFITACQSEGLIERLSAEGFGIHRLAQTYPEPGDWDNTKHILASYPNAWVVLDGYHFNEVYHQRVKEAGHKLLVIDDMAHLKHYCADIVLNQNLNAERLYYSYELYTHLLVGTRYVLLRREFIAWRGWKREIPEIARHVLVTLGGSDPENYTLTVIQALDEIDIPGLEATVVIGASNPYYDVLEAAAGHGRIPVHLIRDAKNMPELMAWADMAVSGGGTTVWESAFMGLPAVVLVLADNQEANAKHIEKQKAGRALGRAERISVQSLSESIVSVVKDLHLRTEISKNAQQMIDGQGVQRVITIMQETGLHRVNLRLATPEDCRLLWEWANDLTVRDSAFNQNPIPWDEHKNWFQQKLSDSNCLIYIVLNEQGTPIGQMRFDMDSEGSAELDISIAVKERNKGYGIAALQLACRYTAQEFSIRKVLAHIKEENKASINAFTKAGFNNKGRQTHKGYEAIKMVWSQE